jgi:hypothetical protein
MKKLTVKGKTEQAYGKKLTDLLLKDGTQNTVSSLNFEGVYDAYETYQEIADANDLPSNDEILKFRNATRKTNERSKALKLALDNAGIVEPTLENDDQVKLKTMYDVFMSMKGTTPEEAREKASAAIGIEWAA